jgi:Uncharacterized membrane protein (homolog of Drosophila rhomboid)
MTNVPASPADATETDASQPSVKFDFTVGRFSNSLIRAIIWLTFGFYLLTTPTQWLTSWFGWEQGDKIAEWMYNTFSARPSHIWQEPWTIITHMFMHGGTLHFGMNMLTLYVFYKSCREFFPSRTWIVVYFGAGIAGALLYAFLNPGDGIMVGASGGVMGLWGAAIAARIRYQKVPADEQPWESNLSLRELAIFLGLQFATEFLIPNVAHSAHAGGLIAGFVIGYFLPLAQQPRVVASRAGLFCRFAVAINKGPLGKYVHAVTMTPSDKFDPSQDFVAVEYDQVDFRNRRSVWYEALLGTLPATVKTESLVSVASARTVGSETVDQYRKRMMAEAGEKDDTEVNEKKSAKVSSYASTAMMIVFFILNNVTIAAHLVPYLVVAAALVAATMWYQGMKGEGRDGLGFLAYMFGIAVLVFGGGYALCAWLGQLDLFVKLAVSVAAGHVIQRFIIAPVMIRFFSKTDITTTS